ncbi:MAG: D-glycerate dehydrogenase [Acidobacteria bacterium]|nr:D-glycerate dehydrogenase [Acidobacteriota bacterium]
MPLNVLLTRRIPSSVLSRLEAAHDVEIYDGPSPIPPEELMCRIAGKQALICLLTEKIPAEVIAASDLRVVANIAVGYENIDLAAARARGVIVTNTPDVLTEAVAEFTWALILAAARRLGEGERLLRRGAWRGWTLDFLLGTQLHGKQLGVVGTGRIGRAVAAKAPAFGMIVAFAKRGQPPFPLQEKAAVPLSMDELLTSSDVITLHVPGGEATRHMIDRKSLARMKRSAILVNTSRGSVVDEEALAWALGERLIAAAALDVYEHEPAVQAALLAMDNVILAPHLGSATRETRTAMAALAVENVLAVLSGQPAKTPVS